MKYWKEIGLALFITVILVAGIIATSGSNSEDNSNTVAVFTNPARNDEDLVSNENGDMNTIRGDVLGDNYFTFNSKHYNSVLGDSDAILLNFYADWCPNCNALEPELLNIMSELGIKENVYAFRVNFGDNSEVPEGRELAQKYGVRTQTSFIVLTKDGRVFKSYLGNANAEDLRNNLYAAAQIS